EHSEEKTSITHIEEGFDFLGQHVRIYNGHFLTRPAKKNVKAFLTDIRKVIKDNKAATAYGLIATLNPKIRGWANFHRHAAAKKTFVHVDTAIFNALWRWTRRRHPKKGKRWVKDRYFGRVGNQNWRFFGTAKDKDGKPTRNLLCLASAIPITLQHHLQNMLFYHKGLRVHKKPLPFVACDRNPAILHMQIWV